MKNTEKNNFTITVKVKKSVREELEKLAESKEWTLSHAARNLIEKGVQSERQAA